jgi:hypothetical protein
MLALGLFMVFAEAQARLALGVTLPVALAVGGALQLLAAWRAKQARSEPSSGQAPAVSRRVGLRTAWQRRGIGAGAPRILAIPGPGFQPRPCP